MTLESGVIQRCRERGERVAHFRMRTIRRSMNPAREFPEPCDYVCLERDGVIPEPLWKDLDPKPGDWFILKGIVDP